MISNRKELIEVFNGLSSEFNSIQDGVKNREKIVKNLFNDLRLISEQDPLRNTNIPENHALRKIVSNSTTNIKYTISKLIEEIEKYDGNVKIREDYQNSLLVFVYGKVKAGKSSLGNYMAYGTSKPTQEVITSANPKPHFFFKAGTNVNEEMSEEIMNDKQCFGVDLAEATSSIQGFTLPGLAWIDSPGLHSKNEENGNLAKRYANLADMVVFLSNSSAPARQSDIAEISNLLEQKKPLVILITHSDEYEDDVDDNGNFISTFKMKSKEAQNQQISYFEQELKGLPRKDRLLDMKVYPISTAYVEAGSESTRWKESGIGNFAQRLAEITSTEGVNLKKLAPLENLSNFINKVSQSISKYQEEVDKINKKLSDEREDLQKESEHILIAMQSELSYNIERLAVKYAMDDAGFKKACNQFLDECLQKYIEEVLSKLGQKLDEFNEFIHISEEELKLPLFAHKTETVNYKSTINRKRGGVLGAGLLGLLGASIGAAVFTGGASLLVTGAVEVASFLAAGVAGEKLGELAGKQFDGNKSMNVNVGDNRQDVALATRETLVKTTGEKLQKVIKELDQICFNGTEAWLNEIDALLSSLNIALTQQQQEINKELSTIKRV
jgi:hypothetical protein